MIKLKSLIKESYVNSKPDNDYQDIYNEVQQEFRSGQKYQTWRLIPARDILLLWATFAKYGRVDENKLDKIWEIIKENVFKIIINTEIWHGNDPDFFGVDSFDEIPDEENNRHSLFISDRSNSQYVRSWSEVEGNARYSDAYKNLYKLLEKCYSVSTAEELLIAIDAVLNFVHGLGHMAKWFVEGGTITLDKIRDFQAKGINLIGKLSESLFKSFEVDYGRGPMYVEVFKNPTSKELRDSKPHFEIGALLTDKDIYVWNREKAYHKNVMRQLNLSNPLPIIIVPDLSNPNRMDVMITDASSDTTWHHNPNIEKFLIEHPFFRNKIIDHISYWDEDIVGDWSDIKSQ